jgi:uncharacterized repeat protein (TIGR03803 family)
MPSYSWIAKSYRVFVSVLASCFFAALPTTAQSTIATLGPSSVDTYTALIRASDGNFYATSVGETYFGYYPGTFNCPSQSGSDCTFLDKITPIGEVTQIHTFEAKNGVNQEGFGPTGLVQGADGYLYGSTYEGGITGFGTIYKISPDGKFTLLSTFPRDSAGNAPDGTNPGPLIFGADGYLYGTSNLLGTPGAPGFNLFRISTSGELFVVATAAGYLNPTPVVQASDGFFYLSAQSPSGAQSLSGATILQISLGGAVNPVHTFAADGHEGLSPRGALVEGPDLDLYGTAASTGSLSTGLPNYSGTFFKVSKTGLLLVTHTFGPNDGQLVNPEIALGSDGNFYGTTYVGGSTTPCPSGTAAGTGIGCGTFFQASPSGPFATVYSFQGTGADGAQPTGTPFQGDYGTFYGTFFNQSATNNVIFDLALSPALPAPIQLSFTDPSGAPLTSVAPNAPVLLTWKVLNAFSLTAQQCFASVQGSPDGVSGWAGMQNGKLTGQVYTGSSTILTPTQTGLYTYALTCGGKNTGTAHIVVGDLPQIFPVILPHAVVSKVYLGTFQAKGGVQPYQWGSSGGSFPAGLQIEAATGLLGGTPTQFGSYNLVIAVKDSASPPQFGTFRTKLIVDSGLALIGNLPNGVEGNAYDSTATATGGLPQYTWALVKGALPNGLTLNKTTGVVSGTPTTSGKFGFTLSLTDSEGNPDEITRAFTISTVVPPLTLTFAHFDCTVQVACPGTIEATGGTPPYSFKVIPDPSGAVFLNFPAGLTLAADGSFTGLPKQELSGTASIQVTDSETPMVTATGNVGFTIVSGLRVVSVTVPPATVGLQYRMPPPVATGGLPPYVWTLILSDAYLATQFYVDPSTGILASKTGAVLRPGSYRVLFQVTDAEGIESYASMSATLVINAAPISSVTTLASLNTTAGTGMNVTLKATVTDTAGTPSGMVTFMNGSESLGSSMLDAIGSATLTTSFSSVGVYNLTASYSGGANVTGSISNAITETVVMPAITATANPGTLTVASGASGALTLTLTPVGGYTGTVTFSCGAPLPAHVSCTFAPSSLTITPGSGAVTDVLTVTTSNKVLGQLEEPARGFGRGIAFALIMPVSLLGLFQMRRRESLSMPQLARWMFTLLCLASVGTALIGCGAASSTTPKGNYTITVNLSVPGLSGPPQTLTVPVVVN